MAAAGTNAAAVLGEVAPDAIPVTPAAASWAAFTGALSAGFETSLPALDPVLWHPPSIAAAIRTAAVLAIIRFMEFLLQPSFSAARGDLFRTVIC